LNNLIEGRSVGVAEAKWSPSIWLVLAGLFALIWCCCLSIQTIGKHIHAK